MTFEMLPSERPHDQTARPQNRHRACTDDVLDPCGPKDGYLGGRSYRNSGTAHRGYPPESTGQGISLAQPDRERRVCLDHRTGKGAGCERPLRMSPASTDAPFSRNTHHNPRPSAVSEFHAKGAHTAVADSMGPPAYGDN